MGKANLDPARHQIEKLEAEWQPRQVLLFSGHMIDAPGRHPPRFPADKEAVAAQKIAAALDQLGSGPDDLALTQGACGGDLLFTEACQQRKVIIQWMQPFHEPEFIQKSVICRGEAWRDRYVAAKAQLTTAIRSAPEELGSLPEGIDSYERCNLWLLHTGLAYGVEKVHFICIWDGGGGDGKGGTAHMFEEVKRRSGNVTWIDTRTL